MRVFPHTEFPICLLRSPCASCHPFHSQVSFKVYETALLRSSCRSFLNRRLLPRSTFLFFFFSFFLFFLFPSFPFLLTGTSEVYKFKSGKGTLHVFCLDKFLETAYQIADAHPAFFHEFVLSVNAAFIVITV